MTNDFINKTLGIEEAYQMPERTGGAADENIAIF